MRTDERDRRLEQNLERLNLRTVLENHQSAAAEAAERQISHIDFLRELIEDEAAERNRRTSERRLRDARLPQIKTIDQFDFTFPDEINQPLVMELLRLRFVEERANVVMMAQAGRGKTHLALALAYQACVDGQSVLFTKADDMIDALVVAREVGTLARVVKKYNSPKLLVIDELGFEAIAGERASLFFKVVSARYERGSMVITTNRAFKEWPVIFQDPVVTSAIIERVAHHCHVVPIKARISYRMRDRFSS
jgi:DNA replication protein DnaC